MSSTTTKLRRAHHFDCEGIADLARREVETGLGWTWRSGRVASTLARADTLCNVAVVGERCVGFCIATYRVERLHLLLLAVGEPWRGQGIGRRLVAWHETCAQVAGLWEIELEVRATNRDAVGFYEAQGFEVTGRIRGYYQGREDALKMRKKLGA